jgi:hypothetical protein
MWYMDRQIVEQALRRREAEVTRWLARDAAVAVVSRWRGEPGLLGRCGASSSSARSLVPC